MTTEPEMTAEAHRETTRREFARQAESFERSGSIFRDVSILDWISERVALAPGSRVLDVAGGTGALGRRLAADGAGLAIVADLTPEMLRQGARAAEQDDQRNVVFLQADATRLPFADEQFDLVVTRFALHHILDPAAALAEMARVCRHGGRVIAIDMIREADQAGHRQDELERLRDPSHREALEEPVLQGLLGDAGIDAGLLAEREQQLVVEPWLDQAGPGAEERAAIVRALREELEGGESTGLRPLLGEGGELRIVHRWVVAGGTRA